MIGRLSPPLGAGADRLAALHAAAFAPERGWSATEIASLAAAPGAALLAAAQGFALVRVAADEAELLTLAVLPDARRHGLGAALLGAAEAAARTAGAVQLFLDVAADNAPARALYARAGYQACATRPAYYPRPGRGAADALILTRALAEPGVAG